MQNVYVCMCKTLFYIYKLYVFMHIIPITLFIPVSAFLSKHPALEHIVDVK